MKRVSARVTGRVQGVFFRDSTSRRAVELGLTGWVRNEPDGSVMVEAQGQAPAVDDLVEWLQHGPPRASVVRVDVSEAEQVGDEVGFATTWAPE